jgi:hypothetical protein
VARNTGEKTSKFMIGYVPKDATKIQNSPLPNLTSFSVELRKREPSSSGKTEMGRPARVQPILNWCNRLWVLKKSIFPQNSQNLGDRKCLGN